MSQTIWFGKNIAQVPCVTTIISTLTQYLISSPLGNKCKRYRQPERLLSPQISLPIFESNIMVQDIIMSLAWVLISYTGGSQASSNKQVRQLQAQPPIFWWTSLREGLFFHADLYLKRKFPESDKTFNYFHLPCRIRGGPKFLRHVHKNDRKTFLYREPISSLDMPRKPGCPVWKLGLSCTAWFGHEINRKI